MHKTEKEMMQELHIHQTSKGTYQPAASKGKGNLSWMFGETEEEDGGWRMEGAIVIREADEAVHFEGVLGVLISSDL